MPFTQLPTKGYVFVHADRKNVVRVYVSENFRGIAATASEAFLRHFHHVCKFFGSCSIHSNTICLII